MRSSSTDIQRTGTAPLIADLRPIHPPSVDGRPGCETWSVEFSPDGEYFAWSKGHGFVQLLRWPLQGIERPGTPQFAGTAKERTLDCGQTVWGLAFGPRASKYAGRSDDQKLSEKAQPLLLATGLNDGVIKVWEVETGHLCFNLSGHEAVVRDLVFAPNGSLTLVSGSRDTTLRIWNLTVPTSTHIGPFRVQWPLLGPFRPSSKVKELHVLRGHRKWVSSVSVSPDCSMIASVCRLSSKVFLWSMRSYTFIRNLFMTGTTLYNSCDFSPDGALLATATGFGEWEVYLWDPYTGERLYCIRECFSYRNIGMHKSIESVRFSSKGLHLAFSSGHREIRVWELEQDKPLMESDLQERTCGLCCTFHPQGGVLATGTREGHVKFWSAPLVVPSLVHFCRMALRFSVSTHQVMALPIPRKIKDILTYRNRRSPESRCSYHYWQQ